MSFHHRSRAPICMSARKTSWGRLRRKAIAEDQDREKIHVELTPPACSCIYHSTSCFCEVTCLVKSPSCSIEILPWGSSSRCSSGFPHPCFWSTSIVYRFDLSGFEQLDYLVWTTVFGLACLIGGIVFLAANRGLYRFMEGYGAYNPVQTVWVVREKALSEYLEAAGETGERISGLCSSGETFPVGVATGSGTSW